MAPQLVGHHAPDITPAVITQAVLESGGIPVEDRDLWLAAVELLPGRRDFHDRTLRVAVILARNADSENLAAPGISNLMRVCGLSERQVYRILRHLRDSSLLGWVTTGATCLKRGNWRSTYVLTLPKPPKELSPRVTPPTIQRHPSRARAPWDTSPAMRYARRIVSNWTDRQFMTAITYPPEGDRPYGPPVGKSTWRILLWRVKRYLTPDGTFQGRLALIPTQPHRGTWTQGDDMPYEPTPDDPEKREILKRLAFAAARRDDTSYSKALDDLKTRWPEEAAKMPNTLSLTHPEPLKA